MKIDLRKTRVVNKTQALQKRQIKHNRAHIQIQKRSTLWFSLIEHMNNSVGMCIIFVAFVDHENIMLNNYISKQLGFVP